MVPTCIQPHVLNDVKYPFSLQLLVKCILRALCRYDHLTLSAENPSLVCRVIFGMFSSYKKTTFETKKRLDKIVEINFTNECLDILLPQNIVDIANQCLQICNQHPNQTPPHDKIFDRFLELIQTYQAYFGVENCDGADQFHLDSMIAQFYE